MPDLTAIGIDTLAVVGGILFGWCGLRPAWATLKAGRSIGVPLDTSLMIVVGAIAMYAYLRSKYGFDWLLAVNYAVEIVCWGVLAWFAWRRPPCPF